MFRVMNVTGVFSFSEQLKQAALATRSRYFVPRQHQLTRSNELTSLDELSLGLTRTF